MTFKDWWETSGLQNKPKNKEVALLTYGDIKLLCDMAYYSGQQASKRDHPAVVAKKSYSRQETAGLPRESEEWSGEDEDLYWGRPLGKFKKFKK
jgi:hypothetical protein